MRARLVEDRAHVVMLSASFAEFRLGLAEAQQRVDELTSRLEQGKRRVLARRKSEIERLHRRLAARHPRAVIANSRAKLGPLEVRLARAEVKGLDKAGPLLSHRLGRLTRCRRCRCWPVVTPSPPPRRGGPCVTRATLLSGKRSRFVFIEVRFPPLSIESMWQRVKPARPTRPRGLSVTFQRSNLTTKFRFVVFGHPIAHSLSPAMHQAALKSLGLTHTYEAIDIGDLQHLHSMVDALRQGIFAGVNVTVPYKRAVMDMVERVDPSAEAVGAANTLVNSRNRVIGYNTDAAGLADELRAYSAAGRTAAVIGSGGGARAAVAACMAVGANVVAVTSRSWGGSETLVGSETAEEFRAMGALPCGWPIPASDGRLRLSEVMRLQWADIARARRSSSRRPRQVMRRAPTAATTLRPSFRGSAYPNVCFTIWFTTRGRPRS